MLGNTRSAKKLRWERHVFRFIAFSHVLGLAVIPSKMAARTVICIANWSCARRNYASVARQRIDSPEQSSHGGGDVGAIGDDRSGERIDHPGKDRPQRRRSQGGSQDAANEATHFWQREIGNATDDRLAQRR